MISASFPLWSKHLSFLRHPTCLFDVCDANWIEFDLIFHLFLTIICSQFTHFNKLAGSRCQWCLPYVCPGTRWLRIVWLNLLASPQRGSHWLNAIGIFCDVALLAVRGNSKGPLFYCFPVSMTSCPPWS